MAGPLSYSGNAIVDGDGRQVLGGSPTMVTTRLGTSVVNHVAGWVPLVIRKTSASGAIGFVQVSLDKTA